VTGVQTCALRSMHNLINKLMSSLQSSKRGAFLVWAQPEESNCQRLSTNSFSLSLYSYPSLSLSLVVSEPSLFVKDQREIKINAG